MSFADKRLVFGCAGPGTPWGTLGAVTQRALAPEGYQVRLEPRAWGGRAPRMLDKGELELNFGATNEQLTRWAYEGREQYKETGPHKRLRVIATIMMPIWYGIAVRFETGITDLRQIAERKLPIRLYAGHMGQVANKILQHYGLSKEIIESFGGRIMPPAIPSEGREPIMAPWIRTGEFDVIMDNIYAANTLEVCYWFEASILHNLRYLPMPDDLVQSICRELGGTPGNIPFRLLRGVTQPTASFSRPHQLIFGRDDMPDEFAYMLAKTLSERRHMFRETLIPYSYDTKTVARDNGVPLHPGALRYYKEQGYPIGRDAR